MISVSPVALPIHGQPVVPIHPVPGPEPTVGFADLVSGGLRQLDQQLGTADAVTRRFVLGEGDIPIHQVTIAIEEARMTLELTMQVRARLIEAYRDFMTMQL